MNDQQTTDSEPGISNTTDSSNAQPDRRRWIGLALLSVGVAMIIVDSTIVNVAIPSIIDELHITLASAEWINSIYSLVFAALLITVGRLGDRYGRRLLYLIGLFVFVGGSIFAGLSPNGSMLILARFVQGVGAAMILPSTLSTVNATFRGRERAIAFGIWGSVIGGMAAFGPLLGGWLTTDYSWRWAFFINVPIGIAAVIGTIMFVRETRDEQTRTGWDIPGFLSVTIGLTSLVFGLIEGQRYGWWKPDQPFTIGSWTWPFTSISIVPVAFTVGVLGLICFTIVEWRRTKSGAIVLADLRLFKLPSFRYGNITATVVSLGEFGMVFILPLFVQAVLGYSALQTGYLLLALAAGAFIGGPIAATLAGKIGARRVVTSGMGLEAMGILSLGLLLSPSDHGWKLAPSLFVYGIGVGLATAQLTSVILNDVPSAQSGQASGMQSTFRQVGSALGIALLGSLLATGLATGTRDRLSALGIPPNVVSGIAQSIKSSAGQSLPQVQQQVNNPAVGSAIKDAFAHSAQMVSFVAAGFVIFGFALSWLIPESRDDTEQDTERSTRARPAPEVVERQPGE
jgi:EmrB/QacA subfamily drug resistance transporter